jgi:hypothetical protein
MGRLIWFLRRRSERNKGFTRRGCFSYANRDQKIVRCFGVFGVVVVVVKSITEKMLNVYRGLREAI